jgi:single-strand DNA-binding protein
MNNVFLMGNLTRDPDVRTLPSGSQVADIGLAVNENYKDKEGNNVDRTLYVDIVAWGRQAELCAEYLSKGSPVMVEGKLQLDQWQTEAGEKRSKMRVRANRVQFLNRRAEGENAPRRTAEPALSEEEEMAAIPF